MLSRVSIIFFAFSLCLPTASASSSNENVTNQQEAHTISILDMFRYFNKQAIRTIVRARYGLENAILGEDFDIDMSYNACARPSSSGDRKRSPYQTMRVLMDQAMEHYRLQPPLHYAHKKLLLKHRMINLLNMMMHAADQ